MLFRRKPPRKRRGKVSDRKRAKAISVLAELAADPTNPAHVRGNAARALISADGRSQTKDSDDAPPAVSGPRQIVLVPDNGRNPEAFPVPSFAEWIERIRGGDVPDMIVMRKDEWDRSDELWSEVVAASARAEAEA